MRLNLDSFRSAANEERRPEDERPLLRALRFSFQYGITLAGISVLWFVCLIPVVTVGPATLGVYHAIFALRRDGHINWRESLRVVRSNFGGAVLLGSAPTIFVGIAILYMVRPPAILASVAPAIGVALLYLGCFVGLLLIPTFIQIAGGAATGTALRESYVWIARNPTIAVRIVIVTTVLFVFCLALTIALILVFPTLACSYHTIVIDRDMGQITE